VQYFTGHLLRAFNKLLKEIEALLLIDIAINKRNSQVLMHILSELPPNIFLMRIFSRFSYLL